jgi:hypothetical protein
MASGDRSDGGDDPTTPSSRRFDPTCIDLTDFDVERIVRSTVSTAGTAGGSVAHRLVDVARDATYVSVGLGILGLQRAQVRRRDLERRLRS